MNIHKTKQLHTTMSGPFYSDAKEAKNVSFADTNIINTLPEPFRPTDVCAFCGLQNQK